MSRTRYNRVPAKRRSSRISREHPLMGSQPSSRTIHQRTFVGFFEGNIDRNAGYLQCYHLHVVGGLPKFKPEDSLGRCSEPMSKNTTQRVDYPLHPLCPPFKHHPDPYMKPEGVMEKGTTYRHDYLSVSQLRVFRPIQKANRNIYSVWHSAGEINGRLPSSRVCS